MTASALSVPSAPSPSGAGARAPAVCAAIVLASSGAPGREAVSRPAGLERLPVAARARYPPRSVASCRPIASSPARRAIPRRDSARASRPRGRPSARAGRGWAWRCRPTATGTPRVPPVSASPIARANRVTYARGPVTEWWLERAARTRAGVRRRASPARRRRPADALDRRHRRALRTDRGRLRCPSPVAARACATTGWWPTTRTGAGCRRGSVSSPAASGSPSTIAGPRTRCGSIPSCASPLCWRRPRPRISTRSGGRSPSRATRSSPARRSAEGAARRWCS